MNAALSVEMGKAIEDSVKRDCKIMHCGQPANINSMVC
jgi:hypothetical protein